MGILQFIKTLLTGLADDNVFLQYLKKVLHIKHLAICCLFAEVNTIKCLTLPKHTTINICRSYNRLNINVTISPIRPRLI